jgi:hypothetical protein
LLKICGATCHWRCTSCTDTRISYHQNVTNMVSTFIKILGNGAELRKHMECRHVSRLLLDGENRCSRMLNAAKGKKETCLR